MFRAWEIASAVSWEKADSPERLYLWWIVSFELVRTGNEMWEVGRRGREVVGQ